MTNSIKFVENYVREQMAEEEKQKQDKLGEAINNYVDAEISKAILSNAKKYVELKPLLEEMVEAGRVYNKSYISMAHNDCSHTRLNKFRQDVLHNIIKISKIV